MVNKLRSYFPTIRSREEIMQEIQGSPKLSGIFYQWTEEDQETFLDFCTGVRGVKVLYDTFFKEIMNPETVPERLEEFLGLILGQKVKIIEVLPGDSARISAEHSLLIMDILVRFEDGTYCNIEMQKIGYKFPGERSACYSADLLLRQYKKVRGEKKKKFSYRDVKGVFMIVLIGKSSENFWKFPDVYKHSFQQSSDTGLEMNLLQKFVFIPLDIFQQNVQNKGVRNKLDAWLAFLSMDSPEMIENLLTNYPEFRAMYEQVYDICLNMERVMDMWSKELLMMDKNTVDLMIDEMQEELNRRKEELSQSKKELQSVREELRTNMDEIQANKAELQASKEKLRANKAELQASKEKLQESKAELQASKEELQESKAELQANRKELQVQKEKLQTKDKEIQSINNELNTKDKEIKHLKELLKQKGIPE